MNSDTPIPSAIRDLLALFDDALVEVRFPDVDREVLNTRLQQVEQAFALVAQRQSELEQARLALDTERAELLKTATRAQQYALVYTSDDDALRERVEAIVLQPTPARKPRKPRRKKDKDKDNPTAQLALAKENAA